MNTLPLSSNNPIVFFDLETTGLDLAEDRIIQLSATKYNLDGTTTSMDMKFNPDGRAIHEEATKQHKMTAEMLINEPKFKDKAKEVLAFFENCSLGGFNILHFDIPFLIEEFHRCGLNFDPIKAKSDIIDVFKILSRKEKRDLTSVYKFYTGKVLEEAHDAKNDNMATMEIFAKQVELYGIASLTDANDLVRKDDKGNTAIDFSGLFVKTTDNKYIYGLGKHKGKRVDENGETMGYLSWVIDKSTFNNSTKFVAEKIRKWLNKGS